MEVVQYKRQDIDKLNGENVKETQKTRNNKASLGHSQQNFKILEDSSVK